MGSLLINDSSLGMIAVQFRCVLAMSYELLKEIRN